MISEMRNQTKIKIKLALVSDYQSIYKFTVGGTIITFIIIFKYCIHLRFIYIYKKLRVS